MTDTHHKSEEITMSDPTPEELMEQLRQQAEEQAAATQRYAEEMARLAEEEQS